MLFFVLGLVVSIFYIFTALQGLHHYLGYWISAPLLIWMVMYQKNTLMVISSMFAFAMVYDVAWYFVILLGLLGVVFLIPSMFMIAMKVIFKQK